MTYIIHPIWFYLIGVAGSLQCTFFVTGIIGLIIAFLMLLVAGLETGGDLEDMQDFLKKFKLKFFLIIGIIFTIVGNFIPSQQTCYTMLVASAFTYENVDYAVETGKDIVDYILETTEEVMDLSADDGSKEE